ncbi:MAG: PKD domain-containing protein [Thermoleophilia bacterium]|nr:PKD domain-containing protein [Thermoleophilia bacterium]
MTAAHTSRRIRRTLLATAAVAGAVGIAGQAGALPPPPPPPRNDPPVAALTVSPNPAAVQPSIVLAPITTRELQVLRGGVLVSFDASASNDPDGTIVRYEWDLDGDGTFEKTTTTPTISRRYTQPGTIRTRVRVTDDFNAMTTKPVDLLLHRAPTPKITASRTVVLPGDTIVLNGNGSTDDSGPIAKYEWDLDGDGTFEKTGPEATTSYGAAGAHTVRLRVTDALGAPATSAISLRVHRQPTASFAVRPVTPGVGQLATLDGAPSEDDGSIARYQWDLDGNGTYETDGGGAATVGTRFAVPGPARVGLRVTDNDGATAETTRTIQVSQQVVTTDVTAPSLRPARTRVRIAKGRVAVALTCPSSEGTCRIGVRLRGTGPLAGRVLGSGSATVRGGRSVTLRIALSKAGKTRLRRAGAIRTTAVVSVTDGAGNRSVTRTTVRVSR